jgi:hypothetical protein
MSVPPEVLQMIQQRAAQQQGAGAPGQAPMAAGGPPTGQNPGTPPTAAGMPTPQRPAGLMAAAGANVQIAMNMLEQALPVFGSESKEGKEVLKVLSMLSKAFGHSGDRELVPSQIMQMVKAEPSLGGGTAAQMMAQRQAAMQQQAQHPQPGQQAPGA